MDILVKSYAPPPVCWSEIYRYMRTAEPDSAVCDTARECMDEIAGALRYDVCYAETPVKEHNGALEFGFARTDSRDLRICLRGCDRAIIFAATVGAAPDRLIAKYMRFSPVKGLCMQAIGSERVEALCDKFCRELSASCAERGETLRPRYSPGYGDLPLEFQKDVFRLLDPPRRIGVFLGESLLMTPVKSVTAIIGVIDGGESNEAKHTT